MCCKYLCMRNKGSLIVTSIPLISRLDYCNLLKVGQPLRNVLLYHQAHLLMSPFPYTSASFLHPCKNLLATCAHRCLPCPCACSLTMLCSMCGWDHGWQSACKQASRERMGGQMHGDAWSVAVCPNSFSTSGYADNLAGSPAWYECT